MKRSEFFRKLKCIADKVHKVHGEELEVTIAKELKKEGLFWEEFEHPQRHPAVRVVYWFFYNIGIGDMVTSAFFLFEEAWEAYEESQQTRPAKDRTAELHARRN